MTRSAQMIFLGVLAVVAGYFLLVASEGATGGVLVGGLVVGLGAVLLQVGVIATGVRMGLADHFVPREDEREPAERPWRREP